MTGVRLMSERLLAQAKHADATSVQTAGALLRRAREAAGLHVAALAVSMKVPVRKLEALEADRLDLLPDVVFVRALASSVCRTLKTDPEPILRLLPQTATPRLGVEEGSLNTPFRAAGEARGPALSQWSRKPAVAVVVVLLVVAAALLLYPKQSPLADPAELAVAGDAVLATNAPPIPAADVAVLPATPAPLAVASPASAPLVSEPAPGLASAPVQQLTAPVVAPAAAAALAVAPASGVLVLRSKGEAWVEVVDAQGQVQVRRTLLSGESAYANGPLPLSVVVGRVDVTEVEIRGKAFSLDAIAKSNVARFEVK
jgi:cytoskeleton protein RodZ